MFSASIVCESSKGPDLVRRLKAYYPDRTIQGYETGWGDDTYCTTIQCRSEADQRDVEKFLCGVRIGLLAK